jgi:hypothetical protein
VATASRHEQARHRTSLAPLPLGEDDRALRSRQPQIGAIPSSSKPSRAAWRVGDECDRPRDSVSAERRDVVAPEWSPVRSGGARLGEVLSGGEDCDAMSVSGRAMDTGYVPWTTVPRWVGCFARRPAGRKIGASAVRALRASRGALHHFAQSAFGAAVSPHDAAVGAA